MITTTGTWHVLGTCQGQPDTKQWAFPLMNGRGLLLEIPEPYDGSFQISYGTVMDCCTWSNTIWTETCTDIPAAGETALTDHLVTKIKDACLVRAHVRLKQDIEELLSSAKNIKTHIVETRPSWTLSALRNNLREYKATLADGTTVTLTKEGPNGPWKARHDRKKSRSRTSGLVIYSDIPLEEAQKRAEAWAEGHVRKI